jgi:hypothetical protein
MSLQEKVFIRLLSDDSSENKYCCDCGQRLQRRTDRDLVGPNPTEFEEIYVSINHGIFLCGNCAYIHQSNYGVEISFVKKLMDNRVVQEGTSALYASHSKNN